MEIPAYEAFNASLRMSERVLEILMRNVSTRSYRHVIPEMADTIGVSKSSVSREFIEQSAKELESLAERRLDNLELLILYLDGLVFGDHHVICAVGVDTESHKHVLGIMDGASENGASATALLEDLVARGLDPIANTSLSSTAPRPCDRPLNACLVRATRCSVAATTKSKTSATSSPMTWPSRSRR
jgi:hypothetical protein